MGLAYAALRLIPLVVFSAALFSLGWHIGGLIDFAEKKGFL